MILGLLAVVLVVSGISTASFRSEKRFSQPNTLAELVALKPEQLLRVDLARINLLCASDLPGSEKVNLADNLATLDRYAIVIEQETEKYLKMYTRNPERFRNIEGFYRTQMLVTVLKQDLGIEYSDQRTNDESAKTFFADSRDIFLGGLLTLPHTGTCASLPVLVVAIGQRLGYPLHLVSTRNHLFARWESPDGKHRFNIECTNGGMTSHPDDYYAAGPFAWGGDDFSGEGFLKSMTHQQALADFLDLRGLCLRMNGRFAEARTTYETALALKPESKILADKYRNSIREEQTGQLISAR